MPHVRHKVLAGLTSGCRSLITIAQSYPQSRAYAHGVRIATTSEKVAGRLGN